MNHLKNSVRLIGYLGKDPQVKGTKTGKKVARFSLATNDSYRDDEGNTISHTQWHNLVAWEKHARTAETYLRKGSEIAIEGKLITRDYMSKEGGKRYITEVIVNELLIIGRKARKVEEEEEE